jgi:Holliday junction resolvase RusA-like endonuclease
MNLILDTFVPGIARTKGSLDVVNAGGRGRGAVLADTELSTKWRRLVAYQARRAYGREPSLLPIKVEIVVALPALDWPMITRKGAGDVDKLARNVLDALAVDLSKPDLAAGVYVDDSQVVDLHVIKLADLGGTLPRGLKLKVWESLS